jgi:hypothetical protein
MKKYKYKVTGMWQLSKLSVEDYLDTMGQAGWKLVTFRKTFDGKEYIILEREI